MDNKEQGFMPGQEAGGALEQAGSPSTAQRGTRRRARGRLRGFEVVLVSLALVCALSFGLFSVAMFSLADSVRAALTPAAQRTTAPAGTFSIIHVVGTIRSTSSDSLGVSEPSYRHADTLDYINKLQDDEGNKGILLYMNTGGGGVYESDEIYRALQAYREKTGRPVWAYMANSCASGGYYICMAAQHLVANYNTTTGSIGVYIALTDTSGLYDMLGVRTALIRSGENKGVGVDGVKITPSQEAVYQSMVDESYNRFVSIVAEGRGISEARVRPLADGRPYTAEQALGHGLVDEIGNWEETLEAFEDLTGATSFTPSFSRQTPLGRALGGLLGQLPQGDIDAVIEEVGELPTGVPLAYAPGLWPAG